VLESSKTLGFLSIPRVNTEFSNSLPSWAVDWSEPSTIDPLLWIGSGKGGRLNSPFMATGQPTRNDSCDSVHRDNLISVSGYYIDRLETLSSICPVDLFPVKEVMEKAVAVTATLPKPAGENTIEAARRTLGILYLTGNLVKVAFSVASIRMNRRDSLFLWNKMALGGQHGNEDAIYSPTGEPLETAYVKTLNANWKDPVLDPESTLENFRIWRKSIDTPLRRLKMAIIPVQYHWIITILQ
jgi:hypothetical protein